MNTQAINLKANDVHAHARAQQPLRVFLHVHFELKSFAPYDVMEALESRSNHQFSEKDDLTTKLHQVTMMLDALQERGHLQRSSGACHFYVTIYI